MLLEYLCCPGAIQVLNHSVASKGSRAKHRNKRQRCGRRVQIRGRRVPDITAHTHFSLLLAGVFRSSILTGRKMKLTLGG